MIKSGCYTAIVTPFTDDGVDYKGLGELAEFQIANGITGILAVGTTGESPTLSWDEHDKVVEVIADKTKNRCMCIAGTGSNNTDETIQATKHAQKFNADAVLLVEPYYNGPSSLEIRREYVAPVAETFPDLEIIPYVIPGRTGTQLLPQDIALLSEQYKNVNTVKEATGNPDNMKQTRQCCGPDYRIMSGDDGMTFEMMTNPEIKGSGVISVISNIAPRAVTKMVQLIAEGNLSEAKKLSSALDPLFQLVTVKTTENTPYGQVSCRARNPLAVKTLMSVLNMPSGKCRRPIGKMTKAGLDKVLEAARRVYTENPDILKPIAEFFNIDVEERLTNPSNWESLYYKEY